MVWWNTIRSYMMRTVVNVAQSIQMWSVQQCTHGVLCWCACRTVLSCMCLLDIGSVVNLSLKDLNIGWILLNYSNLYLMGTSNLTFFFSPYVTSLYNLCQKNTCPPLFCWGYLFDHGVKALRDPPNIYRSQWEGIVHSSASWPSGAHLVWFGAQLLQTLGKKPSSFAQAILDSMCFFLGGDEI